MRDRVFIPSLLIVGVLTVHALGYSGGSGTAQDPYQLATTQDWVELSQTERDWTKHFVQTAHIDMSGITWTGPVIKRFSGTLNGNGFTVRNMTMVGEGDLGLIGGLHDNGVIRNIGVVDANVMAEGDDVGILAGWAVGTILHCYTTGKVTGYANVGGLTGLISGPSILRLTGGEAVGCYSSADVSGVENIGGLIGVNSGQVSSGYSTGSISGLNYIGGLLGANEGEVSHCYSTGPVNGEAWVGGLLGEDLSSGIYGCFWDVETSGLDFSPSGTGLITEEMFEKQTYLAAGWDFVNESSNGLHETWQMLEGGGYPVLSIFNGYQVPTLAGQGAEDSPYQISTAVDLGAMSYYDPLANYILTEDIDLAGISWFGSVLPYFNGQLDGNGHVIQNLTLSGGSGLGLIKRLGKEGVVNDLGLATAEVTADGSSVGILVAHNDGTATHCFSTGEVKGYADVGGLVGFNFTGYILSCYSTANVQGDNTVGGLSGSNYYYGHMQYSYCTGQVTGKDLVGGVVGADPDDRVKNCIWDIETSGTLFSDSGIGLTTAQMMSAEYLGLNGWANDPNWRVEDGIDYPRLSWEATSGEPITEPVIDWIEGVGTQADPYRVVEANQLLRISQAPILWDSRIRLENDIDMNDLPMYQAILPVFSGSFNGNGYTISRLAITGGNNSGLVGRLSRAGRVQNLGIVEATVKAAGDNVGILIGDNLGIVSHCFSTGSVRGTWNVGGMVGKVDDGHIGHCYSTAEATGARNVGGLAGFLSDGHIGYCYSTGTAWATINKGGLIGYRDCSGLIDDKCSKVLNSFWDVETSLNTDSAGGTGLLTSQMRSKQTYLDSGWDFWGETDNGPRETWFLSREGGYPILNIFNGYQVPSLTGSGTQDSPYQLSTVTDLAAMTYYDLGAYYQLTDDIDLAGIDWPGAVLVYFGGSLNGNGFVIRNMTMTGDNFLGLVGRLTQNAMITNLGVTDANITGTGNSIGILAGDNLGTVTYCYSTGVVDGENWVGGLIGRSVSGQIYHCYSSGNVNGVTNVGGLIGTSIGSQIGTSYSTSSVAGTENVGGLVGMCDGGNRVTACYSTGPVSGDDNVGGFIGYNFATQVNDCYSTGTVEGEGYWVHGFIGYGSGNPKNCFWDVETSGQALDFSSIGLTTEQMTEKQIYLDAGWDFVDESNNGLREVWQMSEGGGYPVLSIFNDYQVPQLEGEGTRESPYLLYTADDLAAMVYYDLHADYQLAADIDLAGIFWGGAVLDYFSGHLDGQGFEIRNMTLTGYTSLGFVRFLTGEGVIKNLGIIDVVGTSDVGGIGMLTSINYGTVSHCYAAGSLVGYYHVGAIASYNLGNIYYCHSQGTILGDRYIGGIVGRNGSGWIVHCSSTAQVEGELYVGPIVGHNTNLPRPRSAAGSSGR